MHSRVKLSNPKGRYAKVRISPPHPKHAQVAVLNSIRAAEGNALHSTRHAACARKLDTLPRCVGGGKLDSTPSNPPHSPKHPPRLCSPKHPKRGITTNPHACLMSERPQPLTLHPQSLSTSPPSMGLQTWRSCRTQMPISQQLERKL